MADYKDEIQFLRTQSTSKKVRNFRLLFTVFASGKIVKTKGRQMFRVFVGLDSLGCYIV